MNEGFDIRLPNLTEGDEKEQLRQIRSYLYQLAGQLQFALRGTAAPVSGGAEPASGMSFALIKKQLLRSAEVAEAYGNRIRRQLESAFLTAHLTAGRADIGELRMGEYCLRVDADGHFSLI